MHRFVALIGLSLVLACVAPALAHANRGGRDRERAEVALMLGHAGGEAGDNRWGFGIGLSLGYALPSHIYVGADLLHHRGFEEEGERHHVRFVAQGAFGYELHLPFIVIRPQLLGGVADVHTTRDVDGGFLSPVLSPSLFGAVVIGPFMGGLDLRYAFVTRPVDNGDNLGDASAAAFYLHLGLRI